MELDGWRIVTGRIESRIFLSIFPSARTMMSSVEFLVPQTPAHLSS